MSFQMVVPDLESDQSWQSYGHLSKEEKAVRQPKGLQFEIQDHHWKAQSMLFKQEVDFEKCINWMFPKEQYIKRLLFTS